MISLFRIAFLGFLISLAQAHFTFVRVAVNGDWQEPFRFVRNKTSPFDGEPPAPGTTLTIRRYNDYTYQADMPESVRCGRDNLAHAAETEILTVRAGDTLEYTHTRLDPLTEADLVRWENCPNGRASCYFDGSFMEINHPGPVVAHLSRVPEGTDIRSYDGSGEWTKIHTLGLNMKYSDANKPVYWLASNHGGQPARFTFKIPAQTPAGQYLLRMDLIMPGQTFKGTPIPGQLYPSCTHLNIESVITGSLPRGIKIPEDFADSSSGMWTSQEMHYEQKLDDDYVYPGGPLWDGVNLVQDKPDPKETSGS